MTSLSPFHHLQFCGKSAWDAGSFENGVFVQEMTDDDFQVKLAMADD